MSKNPTSQVIKRSIVIDGLKTSISLEEKFWRWLKHIAGSLDLTLSNLVGKINADRRKAGHTNLSSSCRLHVVDWLAEQADLLEVTEAAQ